MTAFFDDAEVAEFREIAESRMVDTCKITKPGVGKGPFNETTGKYDPPAPVTVYEGKCCIPRAAANARDTRSGSSGEANWAVGEYPIAIPITSPTTAGVAPGHTVQYLTARDDPSLAGREFGIVAPLRQTTAKDRRFKMKEVVG